MPNSASCKRWDTLENPTSTALSGQEGWRFHPYRLATHSQEGGYDVLNLACGDSRSSCDTRSRSGSGPRARVSPSEQSENRHVETQRGEVQVQSRPGSPKS